MRGLSAICLLFVIDAVWGLADGQNMFTLKPGGGTGITVNIIVLVGCLILGPALWRIAQARAWRRAHAHYERYLAGEISEQEALDQGLAETRDFR
jgi:hypothetical protein